jgi:broad specificity polyphosphatase/5'/3'-nucleotidase SurE
VAPTLDFHCTLALIKQWVSLNFALNFEFRAFCQGQRPPGTFSFDAWIGARHVRYFWVKITYPKGQSPEESDLRAIDGKAISVTPIRMDFTDYEWRKRLSGLGLGNVDQCN